MPALPVGLNVSVNDCLFLTEKNPGGLISSSPREYVLFSG